MGDITQQLTAVFTARQATAKCAEWVALSSSLPAGMTLAEVLDFLSADTDTARRSLLDAVDLRLGNAPAPGTPVQKRIRILTMHGAKGLSGEVVFIPSVEQGIMPSFRAIQAAGLLIEHRRLFYVSLTRAKAACIVSHSALHTGAQAQRIRQQSRLRLPRSQFLTEMQIPSTNRTQGLTQAEAAQINADIASL